MKAERQQRENLARKSQLKRFEVGLNAKCPLKVGNNDVGINSMFVDNRVEHMAQRMNLEDNRSYPFQLFTKDRKNHYPKISQRKIENAIYNQDSIHKDAVESFFNAFNDATTKAFEYVITVPNLNALANLDGHTQLWCQMWDAYLKGGAPKFMAARFGYVIESLVSDPKSTFCPSTPSGYRILTQVTVGGTRPDVVLTDTAGNHIAWLDLTASNSVDHIFSKDNWDKRIDMYAEITYPSLNSASISLMRQNKDNTGSIDPVVFQQRVAMAEQEYEAKKTKWREIGERFKKSKYKIDRITSSLFPDKLRTIIREKLQSDFGVFFIDEKLVPSILCAMGVGSTSWGYNLGYVENLHAGEAWLVDNCPSSLY